MARRRTKKNKSISTGLGCAFIVAVVVAIGWISENDLWPAVFGIAIVAGIIWAVIKLSRRESAGPQVEPSRAEERTSQFKKPSRDEENTISFRSQAVDYAHQPTGRSPLQWIDPGQTIRISDIMIDSGMVYVADGESDEASAINRRLAVSKSVRSRPEPLSYYPQYASLSPDQRRCYLEWLSANRRDENPQAREFGYLFLFFYGIERRLLIENALDRRLLHAVADLMERYSPYGRSNSLPSYTTQLLHFWAAKQGADVYRELCPWIMNLRHANTGYDELAIVLADLFRLQKPMPTEIAYMLASRHELSRQSVVLERVPDEFRKLFETRYKERFSGTGMMLRCGKATTEIEYHPASPTLLSLAQTNQGRRLFTHSVPNVLATRSQFTILSEIWNSCIEDLGAYSRQKAKSVQGDEHKAHAALPAELRGAVRHPLHEKWLDLVLAAGMEEGCAYLQIAQLATLFGLPVRDKLTQKQSQELNTQIEALGFACEPDSRHWSAAYGWRDIVGVFPQAEHTSIKVSTGFLASAALMRLGFMIANADGQISSHELDSLRELIEESSHLSTDEHQRLCIEEQLLKQNPDLAKRTLTRVAAHISAEAATKVGSFLVRIAASDSVISKQEQRVLVKVFAALGLPMVQLEALLSKTDDFTEPVVIQGAPISGEPIPARNVPVEPAFHLDMSKVAAITAQTSELVAILTEVMAEPEPEEESPVVPQKLEPSAPEFSLNIRGAESLAAQFRPILVRLASRSEWPRNEFDQLCAEFNLMPLSVYDAINEWADEHLGDFLLEGDSAINVNRELLPEGAKNG